MPKGIYPRPAPLSLTCGNCGQTFLRNRSEIRGQATTFCSLACRVQYSGDTLSRFEKKYIPEPNSGCWLWTGTAVERGYGMFWMDGFNAMAHRAAYEIFVGPIPPGLFACHRCDNKLCVNPEHIFIGTPGDNTRDRDAKDRQAKGEQFARSKITKEIVLSIRASSMSDTEWAGRLGVSKGTINHIRHRRNWRHVEAQ